MEEHSNVARRLFYTILLVLNLEKGFAENCDFNIESLMSKGVALDEHAFWESTVSDETECARHCVKRRICKSFNFDSKRKRCELNDALLADDMTSSRDGVNLAYSDIAVWPSQIDPSCYDRPCGDDEVCIPGQQADGSVCSFTCFKLYNRCPLPDGIEYSQPRTVGSTFEYVCERGYVGGDTALCLPTGQWNKTLDTTCSPLIGSSCTMDTDCAPINASCIDKTCQCNDRYTYNSTLLYCMLECEPGWLLFEESCYLFELSEMSYMLSRSFCEGHGSHLVQVDTGAELEFLRDKMREIPPGPNTGYWNDLFEVTTNRNERWRTTNDSYNPQGWDGANPDDYFGKESCTIFKEHRDYLWADVPCVNDVRTDITSIYGYLDYRPVCEKDP